MKMGELADSYGYSDLGVPVGVPQAPPPDNREAMPLWARQAAAYPDYFDAQDTGWPQQRAAKPEAKPNPLVPFSAWRAEPAKRTAGTIAADVAGTMIPKEPLDIGLAAATGGGSIPFRVAAGAIGALAQPSDAQAASLKALRSATEALNITKPNPANFHRISDVKLTRPLNSIPFDIEGTRPGTNVVPDDWLKGKVITPMSGDPTSRGVILKSVDDVPLTTPYKLQGGHGYIREEEGYANDAATATRINKRVRQLQDLYGTDQIMGTHMKMGPQSGDFAQPVWGSLARLLPNSPIVKSDREVLDEAIRANMAALPKTDKMIKAGRDWPVFPGVEAQNLPQHLAAAPDAYRKSFINTLTQQQGKIPGLPDPVAVRYATTDPELLYQPAGASGLSMTQLTGGRRPSSHADFPVHVEGRGHYGLESPLRQEVMFPDIVEHFDKTQPPNRWLRKMYMPPADRPHGQLVNDRWINDVGQYRQDTAQMGELAAFDKYIKNRFGWDK